jgi:hypothetical protein
VLSEIEKNDFQGKCQIIQGRFEHLFCELKTKAVMPISSGWVIHLHLALCRGTDRRFKGGSKRQQIDRDLADREDWEGS